MGVRVYSCKNATLLEIIICCGSNKVYVSIIADYGKDALSIIRVSKNTITR